MHLPANRSFVAASIAISFNSYVSAVVMVVMHDNVSSQVRSSQCLCLKEGRYEGRYEYDGCLCGMLELL